MFGNISLGPSLLFARLCVIHWGLFAPAYPAKAKDPLWSGAIGSVAPSLLSASIAGDMCCEPSSWIALFYCEGREVVFILILWDLRKADKLFNKKYKRKIKISCGYVDFKIIFFGEKKLHTNKLMFEIKHWVDRSSNKSYNVLEI